MWQSMVAAVLLSTASAGSTDSCAEFVDQYLVAGWPSGTVFYVQIGELGPVGLTLEYPRYPRVAGVLRGAGTTLQVGASHAELQVEVVSGENARRATLTDCGALSATARTAPEATQPTDQAASRQVDERSR